MALVEELCASERGTNAAPQVEGYADRVWGWAYDLEQICADGRVDDTEFAQVVALIGLLRWLARGLIAIGLGIRVVKQIFCIGVELAPNRDLLGQIREAARLEQTSAAPMDEIGAARASRVGAGSPQLYTPR